MICLTPMEDVTSTQFPHKIKVALCKAVDLIPNTNKNKKFEVGYFNYDSHRLYTSTSICNCFAFSPFESFKKKKKK